MESAQAPCTTEVTVDPGTSIDVTVLFWPRDDGTCATVGSPVAMTTTAAPPAGPVRFDGSLGAMSDRGGCGPAHFYAIDPGATVVLHAVAEQLLMDNVYSGEATIERQLTLPSAELEVIVEEGPGVRGFLCSDVGGDPVVLRTWTAVAGAVTLTFDIVSPNSYSTGDLELRDVQLRSDDGLLVEMDDITWTDVPVATQQG